MDWIRGLQRAIDYMEEHMTEELEMSQIAQEAYSSSFHFQRTFNLLTGITVGEYIRSRRLSLAGEELNATNCKVIDIALKYGYDTPESFTKAFSRFHGVTPCAARKEGASLKSFNRLSIIVTMKGGNIMEYQIQTRESFQVLVKVKNFRTENCGAEIPMFWSEAKADGTMSILCNNAAGDQLLGLCEPEKKGEKTFRYGIGIECKKDTAVPEGFEIWTIPERTWAIFKSVGSIPTSIQELWKKIYTEFFPQSEYEPLDELDFEAYPNGDNASKEYVSYIYIPVKKKAN